MRQPAPPSPERARTAVRLAAEYAGGASIRAVATRHNISYGHTRRLIIEGGGQMRLRGRRTTWRAA